MLTDEQAERLKAAGWVIGDYGDFLGLTDEERRLVELRAAIGQRVRELRKGLGITQAALAKRMKSSQSRVARVELGIEGSLDLAFRAYFAVGGSFDPAGLIVKPSGADKPARPKARAKRHRKRTRRRRQKRSSAIRPEISQGGTPLHRHGCWRMHAGGKSAPIR
ncbi:MAG: helix-turn-helix transcriptional regulator [Isosphaeraceae bacterium]